ncbi:t-SNARE, partial [Daedalea quercina L-15889]
MSSGSSSSPTTRSRTLLFISYRDSRASSSRFRRSRVVTSYDDTLNDGDEQEHLIGHEPGHVSIDAPLPPRWVDVADQVEEILAGTQAKITVLDKLHAKHVLPGFSDRSAEEREIEAATNDITKDFRQCHALIQRIGTTPKHSFPPAQSGSSHHEDLAAKNVQRGLAAKVQELSATFRKKQRVYMEKLQGHAIKNQDLLIASGTISSRGTEGLSAVDEDVEAASRNRAALAQDMMTADVDLRRRDHELTQIAQSIASLAELFKDLSAMVIDQGTLLDSIEYNIEQTAVQMEDAVKELDTATRYQKNTGRRACIFLLLLIIFGLIIVLIFKPRRHASSAPSPPSGSADLSPEAGALLRLSMDGGRELHATATLLRRRPDR